MNSEPQYRVGLKLALLNMPLAEQLQALEKERSWLGAEILEAKEALFKQRHLSQNANGDLKVSVSQ